MGKLEEAKKAKEAEAKAAEEKDSEKKGEDKKKDDKEEEKKDAEMKEVEPEEESEDEEEEEEPEEPEDKEEPPKVGLDADEKRIKFRQKAISDLTSYSLSTTFTKFALPETDEGFDDITYEWNKTRAKCLDYLKTWVLEKKNTTRIEDLKPSEWFNTEWARWQKTMQAWHSKQNEHRAAIAKKEADKAAKAAKKAAAKAMAERKKAAEEAAKKRAEEEAAKKSSEGNDKEEDKKEDAAESKDDKPVDADKKEEEEKEEEEEEEEEEDTSKAVDFDGVDIFGIEEVSDIGDGSPLFKMFGFEDWAMLGLRFESHLLSHAFTKDADDPDRKGVHLDHLGFYYQKYFKKTLNL